MPATRIGRQAYCHANLPPKRRPASSRSRYSRQYTIAWNQTISNPINFRDVGQFSKCPFYSFPFRSAVSPLSLVLTLCLIPSSKLHFISPRAQ